ncbi:MAG: hypothetical protein AB9882_10230 [Ignavibacteriaceae bacterium]
MRIIIISLLVAIISLSCNSTDPEIKVPEREKNFIEAADVSCDEIWLKLKVGDIDLPAEGVIRIDGIKEKLFSVTTKDTMLYIDSLEVNRYYKFQVILANNGDTLTGNEATVKTLDTTSHNFTYDTYEFGDYNNSILYDVAIIDENNIWAVGEIYLKDSLGNYDPQPFNAIHWDGNNWELKRILYKGGFWAIRTIFAFNSNDIWFSGYMRYLNGQFIELQIPDILVGWSINKIWGTSSKDIYIVGDAGNIAHYNGTNWTKIESGTNLALTSIYPYKDNEVLISGINLSQVRGVLIKGNRTKSFSVMKNSSLVTENELFKPNLFGNLTSVWVDENKTIYTGGNLLFWYKNDKWDYVRNLPENYINGNPGTYYRGFIYSISGNGSNDYIIAGDRNTLRHYNGKSWAQLGLPYSPTSSIIWVTVAQKGNIAVAVGVKGSKAFIIKLKR